MIAMHSVETALDVTGPIGRSRFARHASIVPISRLDRPAFAAVAYARSISDDVRAVHVVDDREAVDEMQRRWDQWGGPVRLVIVESPYRALIGPLIAYIDATEALNPHQPTTVVLPEFVPRTSGSTRSTTDALR